MNEAETCRTLVRPKLETAGWDGPHHFYSEQTAFTDSRIIVPGCQARRLKKKFSDFLLRFNRDITLAVVSPEDDGRFGSHRYLTFEPKEGVATPRYVCFYLLSPAGLFHVGEASPGSADRNRTTGSRAMQKIPVPVPSDEQQLWFDELCEKVEEAKQLITENQAERTALLPSVLNQIFNGGDH